jgi:hypothetical protein
VPNTHSIDPQSVRSNPGKSVVLRRPAANGDHAVRRWRPAAIEGCGSQGVTDCAELPTGRDPKFWKDLSQVKLNGVHADEQLRSNL